MKNCHHKNVSVNVKLYNVQKMVYLIAMIKTSLYQRLITIVIFCYKFKNITPDIRITKL